MTDAMDAPTPISPPPPRKRRIRRLLTIGSIADCVQPLHHATCDTASPAGVAGVKPGDRVVSFDGHRVKDWDALVNLVENHKPGKSTLVVQRLGRLLTLHPQLVVGQKPDVKHPVAVLGVVDHTYQHRVNPIVGLGRAGDAFGHNGALSVGLRAVLFVVAADNTDHARISIDTTDLSDESRYAGDHAIGCADEGCAPACNQRQHLRIGESAFFRH